MAKLKIKNFGPIKEGFSENEGWIEFKKYIFFIGDQGSGKSTIAKLFSTLSWLEKAINKEDVDKGKISFGKFEDFLKFHRIENYLKDDTYLEYVGDKFTIRYDKINDEYPVVRELGFSYSVPKIMYVPSERNLLNSISDAFDIRGLADNVFTFAEEYKKAQRKFKGKKIDLKIGDFKYEYDDLNDISTIHGSDFYIDILEASSGLQSYTPLFLVSKNLSESIDIENDNNKVLTVTQSIRLSEKISEITSNNEISDTEKVFQINQLRSKYFNSCFYNIVEEPEQNLYPSSQWKILCNLLEFTNDREENKLLITTHSPYLINFLATFVKAFQITNNLTEQGKITIINSIAYLHSLMPLKAIINPEELSVYEFDSKGNISLLDNYKGLPSDENLLNNNLGEINDLFVKLLEIEEQWQ